MRPLLVAAGMAALCLSTTASGQTEPAPAQSPAPIESGALRALDAWTVGALARNQGGLPPALWAGSDPAFLGVLFDRLPATFESPAALALARRALASAGDAPVGDGRDEAARKRYAALGRLGMADELATMAAGAASADAAIAQYAAQAELARGRIQPACQRSRADGVGEPTPFLLRLRAFCAAAAGEAASADLALEVARSANAEDAWFRSAIGAIAAPPPRPIAARYESSLNASVSLAARLAPGAAPLTNASALALVTVARNEAAPAALRAQAAGLAFRRAILPLAAARAALRGGEAPAASLPALGQAVRQAEAAPGSLAAATAIAGALNGSANYMAFFAVARLFHDDIAALTAAPDAAGALAFTRAAIATGDMPLGARLADNAAQAGVEPRLLASAHAALAVGQRLNAEGAALAVGRRIDAAGPNARAAARDVTILSALGFPIDGAARAFLTANPPQGGRRVESGLLAAAQSAAQGRSIGETALIAAIAAAGGAGGLDADSLAALIRALRTAELDDAARGLAIEALNAGPPA